MGTTDPNPSPAPKVPPESLVLRAPPRPVMRLNRRTLIVSATALALGVALASMWALQSKGHRPGGSGRSESYNVEHVAKAEDLDELPSDYSKLPQKPALPPVPTSAAASTTGPPVLGPPLPGELGGPVLQQSRGLSPSAEAVDRQRDAEEAVRSSVFFRIGSTEQSDTSAGSTPSTSVASNAAAGALNLNGASPPAPTSQINDPTAIQSRQGEKAAFLTSLGDTATRNTSDLQPPAPPCAVMAGTVIPAALVTGINSDLPGEVIASVTQPVYDTATGRYLLIPQGSRLIGRYDSQVAFGQKRLLLVWLRLILPDTSSIALDKLPGIDPAGYAGLEDGVNWHWNRILAGAALSTLLGVSSQLAVSNQGGVNGNVVLALRDSAQDTTNQVGQEITRRNLSIQPTLTVRPGFPMDVMVDKDLVLRPYQPLFIQGGPLQ